MSSVSQNRSPLQLELFPAGQDLRNPDPTGCGVAAAGGFEVRQTGTARERHRALTPDLLDRVVDAENLARAARRVISNGGAPGVDGMSVTDLADWLAAHQETLIALLRNDQYAPHPVRGVEIPKDNGGTRQLGIPTVLDRLVQQAIAQVLEPILDPMFSDSSYGFRPGRGAHDALRAARAYVAEGYRIVVDLDLETFFDSINHDVLMARLARHIDEKRVLRLVRRFLQAGLLQGGDLRPRTEGAPQGGPLSPLLANLLLHDLDVELERRGHRFCRYADDCNIYVRSLIAGDRVMASLTRFLEKRLRLRVNREKSAVAPVEERKFLGYRLRADGTLEVAPRSIEKAKTRIRSITRRHRGRPFSQVLADLKRFTQGWLAYFRLADAQFLTDRLDRWIRRRLRAYRLCQCQTAPALRKFLTGRGVAPSAAHRLASSGKGWWRRCATPAAHQAMPNRWLQDQGFDSLNQRFQMLTSSMEPPYR